MPPDGTIVPLEWDQDPELAALAAELEGAGRRARGDRAGGGTAPAPAFAAALRARLVAQLPGGAEPESLPSRPADPTIAPLTRSRPLTPPPAAPTAPLRPRTLRPAAAEAPPLSVASPSRPVVVRRTPTVLPAPRWTALAVAAALIVALAGLRAAPQLPVPPSMRAGEAVGASLHRAGVATPLTAGQALLPDDEVRVAEAGRATVEIGASRVRLGGGSIVRIDEASDEAIRLEQLAGRVWHRAAPAAGGSYTVTTGPIRWTALGTAFDLAREPGAGADRLTLLAIEHDVALEGLGLRATVGEGRLAVVDLSTPPDLTTGALSTARLFDPWLLDNARRDLAAGFPVGVMAPRLAESSGPSPSAAASAPAPAPSTAGPAPSTSETPAGTPRPAGTTSPSPAPAAATPTARPPATPAPTPAPTPKPTPTASPMATPSPTPQSLTLDALECNGGIVLDWSSTTDPRFARYVVLRSASSEIPAAYPPGSGISHVEGSVSTKATKTSSADVGRPAGSAWSYRVLALDGADQVIAASPVDSAVAKALKALGALSVAPAQGGTAFTWNPYGGSSSCFSFYKLVYAADDPTPSYLEGAATAWAGESQGTGQVTVAGLPSGTWWFRLQAIRVTDLTTFVVAETEAVAYTVP